MVFKSKTSALFEDLIPINALILYNCAGSNLLLMNKRPQL